MDRSTDSDVLHVAVRWLEEGAVVYLVTVVRTWGSAPRRPGALMAIHPDGRFEGSVSGGCVEDDLIQRSLRGEFECQTPRLIKYGVSTAVTRRIGLPCGGRLELLVEYIDTVSSLRTLIETMDARQRITRHVCIGTGESHLQRTSEFRPFAFDGDNLVKVFGPAWRMLIIGAGELAQRVAQLALTLDYAVTICDSRPEYVGGWDVEGTEFSSVNPSEFVSQFQPDPRTVILALAHAPVLEDEALVVALQSKAFYVGALGSLKNQRARLKRLQRLGLDQEQLGRLHGPVGLDIGSRTPAEIAIAITAELIQAQSQFSQNLSVIESHHG
jgi:xanthine dehydrogenase accessory factor